MPYDAHAVAEKSDKTPGFETRRLKGALEQQLFGDDEQPVRIGRYTVLEPLGRGAMGLVYLARDPDLDRKVAIKVLAKSVSEGAAERMFREGRALARLTHTNVVTIYEVGKVDEQVFVAMEFVDGGTLRDWMAANPCTDATSLRATLGVFAKAGEGLAKAHASGIVHRDFKPDNVLVGRDGEVRVADFGLAAPPGPETQELLSSTPDDSLGDSDARLTRTGEVVGTPAYMAPEQMTATRTDARSDQYAFCVSLFEALYGRRPYDASGFAELRGKVLRGDTPQAPSGVVPTWVERVVLRGLSLDPEQRYPSMAELLEALRADPAQRRRRSLMLLGGVVLIAGTGAGAYLSGRNEAVSAESTEGPCDGVELGLDGLWDDEVRGAVVQGLSGSERAWVEKNTALTLQELDGYAARWVAGRTDNCEATRVRSEQSEQMFDQREACYRKAAATFAATTDLFAEGSERTVRNSVSLVSGLPSLAACTNLERLAELPAIEPDEVQVVEAMREESARIGALIDAGKGGEVAERIAALARSIEPVRYAPLHAEVGQLQADLAADQGRYEDAAKSYEDAFEQALRAKHDSVLAGAAIGAFDILGPVMMRAEDAVAWRDRARAAVDRLGTRGKHGWQLTSLEGEFACRSQAEGCIELAERALTQFDAAAEQPATTRLDLQGRLATSLAISGKVEESIVLERRVFAGMEATYGPHHPATAEAAGNLGLSLQMVAEFDEARALLKRSIEDLSSAFPDGHDLLASALASVALIEMKQGALESAAEFAQRAQAMFAKVLGPKHRMVASSIRLRARIALADREYQEALALCDEAIALHEEIGTKHFPDEHGHRGEALLGLGRLDEAQTAFETALAEETTLEADSPWAANHLERLARLAVHRGDLDAATRWADQALAARSGNPQPDAGAHRAHATRADIALKAGDIATARKHYEASAASAEAGNPPSPVQRARANLGLARLATPDEARQLIDDTLPSLSGLTGDGKALREALEALREELD